MAKYRILIPTTIVLVAAVLSGWFAGTSGGTLTVYIVGWLAVLVGSLLSPERMIWLLPVAVILPRSLPRLFGQIGFMEISLVLLFTGFVFHVLLFRGQVHTDWFLIIMILIAIPMAISFLLERASNDGIRLYNWLGTCVTYFLVLNLVRQKNGPYRIMFAFALIVTGAIVADVLVFSGGLPTTYYDWARFRSLGTSINRVSDQATGQANYLVGLSATFIPVFVTYAIYAKRNTLRLICGAMILGVTAITFLVATRASLLVAGASLLGVLTVLRNKIGVRRLVLIAFVVALSLVVTLAVFTQYSEWTLERVVDTLLFGDARASIWEKQIAAGMESPFIGHGAIGREQALQRYGILDAHGLLPQAFFEYGLAILIPTVALLAGWVQRSVQLATRLETLDEQQAPVAVASFGIVCGLLAYAIVNVHLLFTVQYSITAFSMAALLASQLLQVRDTDARAGRIHG